MVAALAVGVAAVGHGHGERPTDFEEMPAAVQLEATEISPDAAPTPPPPVVSPAGRDRPTEPARMPASVPVRLQIPTIGVDVALVELGLQADGTLEVPADGFPAGWYTGAPTPGEVGPAIIAGHVDWAGRPGVFFDLRELSRGDEVSVVREDGSTARFRVTRVQRFPKDQFPTEMVYGDLDHAGLRLITCGGQFDPQARSYVDNLVVFAELVDGRDPVGPQAISVP